VSANRWWGAASAALALAFLAVPARAQGWRWGVNLDSSALTVASRDVWRGRVRSPAAVLQPRVALDVGGTKLDAYEGTSLWLNLDGWLPVTRRDSAGSVDQLAASIALRQAVAERAAVAVGYRQYAFLPPSADGYTAGEVFGLAQAKLRVTGIEEAPFAFSAEGDLGFDRFRRDHHLRLGVGQEIGKRIRQKQDVLIVSWSADTHLDDLRGTGGGRSFRFRGEEVTLGARVPFRGKEETRNLGIRFGGLLRSPLKSSPGWVQLEASWVP
jgi:hypothetical protein